MLPCNMTNRCWRAKKDKTRRSQAQRIRRLSGKCEYPTTYLKAGWCHGLSAIPTPGRWDRGAHGQWARWISGIDELWVQRGAWFQEIKWRATKEDTGERPRKTLNVNLWPLREYTYRGTHTHLHICSTHICTHIQSRSNRKHIKKRWDLWGVPLRCRLGVSS